MKMDSSWELFERENHISTSMADDSGGIDGSYNVKQRASPMRNRQESPKEDDSELSAATGHHTPGGTHVGGDCTSIEGSSLGPVGYGHMITPPRQVHTTPSHQQQLKWQALMVKEWYGLCDGALQDIPQIDLQVEIDKGFKFSVLDDSFLCQKKNHFQITVTVFSHKIPKFLKLKDGSIQPIEQFILCLEGIKFEDVSSKIKLKQSKGDRSKIDFQPVVLDLTSVSDKPIKTTICRLHFSETTANNPRKKGKPNPDQKYFSLVVSLKATTKDESSKPLTIVAHVSERIIVRTSPSVIEMDTDPAPSRELTPEHTDCQRQIEMLRSSVQELQTIVCALQQRLRAIEQPHHPQYPQVLEMRSVKTQHSASVKSLSHISADSMMAIQHPTSAVMHNDSPHSHNPHPCDFYC